MVMDFPKFFANLILVSCKQVSCMKNERETCMPLNSNRFVLTASQNLQEEFQGSKDGGRMFLKCIALILTLCHVCWDLLLGVRKYSREYERLVCA